MKNWGLFFLTLVLFSACGGSETPAGQSEITASASDDSSCLSVAADGFCVSDSGEDEPDENPGENAGEAASSPVENDGGTTADDVHADDTDGELTADENAPDTGTDAVASEPATADADVAADQEEVDAALEDESIVYYESVYWIYGQQDDFLGFINVNPYDSYSVCNVYGPYGSEYGSLSIFNAYGSYGGDYGSYSAFNAYASYPPVIFKNDVPFAYLTANPYKSPRIDPYVLMGLLNLYGCGVSR